MHYLIIRPISEDPAQIEPSLDRLEIITGLDKHTLKQKFLGSALNLLKHHSERGPLEDISKELSKEGINSIVVSKDELRRPEKSVRAASIDIGSDHIELISKDGNPLLTVDKDLDCLIVISCKGFKKINTKEMARHVMRFTTPMSPDERLKDICLNQPVMEIYSSGSDRPIRIEGTKFNYSTLGERNRNSTALNFKIILELISKHSKKVIIETGFGENSLPFLNSLDNKDSERAFRDFGVYSFMVSLAHQRGIFQSGGDTGINGLIPLPLLDDLTSIFWAGPGRAGGKTGGAKEKDPENDEEKDVKKNPLPQPPEEFTRPRSKSRALRILGRTLPGYGRFVHGLGPKIIFYPLSLILVGSLIIIQITEATEPLSITLMTAGLMIFSRSFVLIKRKRSIENCPRSKIRSMPMGEVEVGGKAVQKYYLRSPYTYTNCVYYSYKIYEMERTRNGKRMVLKEWNDSGRIPFYLEDDTGRTLITPKEAVLRAGVKETLSGDMLSAVYGSSASGNRKIVETTIPTGSFLYVMGYAHRVRNPAKTKKREMTERLVDLKHDKARLNNYDTDGDGRIDSEEWDRARADVEDQLFRDRLEAGKAKDEVAIGAHPTGGLFFISDKKEEHIIKSMAWKIPLYLASGSGATLGGLFFILKILKNNDILSTLNSIFSNIHIN